MTALQQRCARRRMPETCQSFESHRSNDEYETFFPYLKLPSPAITRVKGKMHPKNSPQRRREWIIRTHGQLGLTCGMTEPSILIGPSKSVKIKRNYSQTARRQQHAPPNTYTPFTWTALLVPSFFP